MRKEVKDVEEDYEEEKEVQRKDEKEAGIIEDIVKNSFKRKSYR